jgi:mono/diheme cytochrome c family protein
MTTLVPSSNSSSPSRTEAGGRSKAPHPVFRRLIRAPRLRQLLVGATGLVTVAITVFVFQSRSSDALGTASVDDGRRLFMDNCAQCHGANADRLPLAPLYSRDFLDSRGDATLLASITDGKGVMPAWSKARSGPFNDDQIRAVLAYINSVAGRTSASALAGTGQAIFTDNCARCHGASADRIPVAPLSARAFLDARTDAQLVARISTGQGLMPGFQSPATGTSLSGEQIQSVVAYLRFNAESNLAGQARRGRDLYVSACLACHGERGDRVAGVALASADDLRRLGDGAVTRAISDGKGAMPGLAASTGARTEEITSLLAYLKAWAGLNAGLALAGADTAAHSASGSALFATNCTGCHGETGDRVASVRLRAADFISVRSDDVLVREISQGNTRGMPAFGQATGGPLSEVDIRSIVEFLRSPTTATTTAVQTSAPAAPSNTPADALLVGSGQTVFETNCVACHAQTRDGVAAARLFDMAWLRQRGDAALSQSITRGKGAMPAWGRERGGPLGPDDVSAVLAFLRSSATEAPRAEPLPTAAPAAQAVPAPAAAPAADPALAAHGKDLFSANCAMCHGETRDKQPAAKLNDAAWLRQRGDEGLRQAISNGKPPMMPAWSKEKGGRLGPEDIAAVVAYLKSAAS